MSILPLNFVKKMRALFHVCSVVVFRVVHSSFGKREKVDLFFFGLPPVVCQTCLFPLFESSLG